jgi:hypothetical protein
MSVLCAVWWPQPAADIVFRAAQRERRREDAPSSTDPLSPATQVGSRHLDGNLSPKGTHTGALLVHI